MMLLSPREPSAARALTSWREGSVRSARPEATKYHRDGGAAASNVASRASLAKLKRTWRLSIKLGGAEA